MLATSPHYQIEQSRPPALNCSKAELKFANEVFVGLDCELSQEGFMLFSSKSQTEVIWLPFHKMKLCESFTEGFFFKDEHLLLTMATAESYQLKCSGGVKLC